MRNFILSMALSLLTWPLVAQISTTNPPVEILYEARNLTETRLVPKWKSTFRHDERGNILYEAYYEIIDRFPDGPQWELRRETWSSYFPSRIKRYSFTNHYTSPRRTVEKSYFPNGTLKQQTTLTYDAENDELLAGRRVEKTYLGTQVRSSKTDSLNLSTQAFEPYLRQELVYDADFTVWEEWGLGWNPGEMTWDTLTQVTWKREAETDSTITRTAESRETGQITHLSVWIYDAARRLKWEEIGGIETGFSRKRYSYNREGQLRNFRVDTMPPSEGWRPVLEHTYSYQATTPWSEERLTFLVEESDWDTGRTFFKRWVKKHFLYDTQGEVDIVLQNVQNYDLIGRRWIRSTENIDFETRFNCDKTLQAEVALPYAKEDIPYYRTTYSYAKAAPCADNIKGSSIRLYPNPIGPQDAFLRIETSWLMNPNVRGEIVDLRGRRVYSFKGRNGIAMDLSVSWLQAGTYFLHLFNNGERLSRTFVKTD